MNLRLGILFALVFISSIFDVRGQGITLTNLTRLTNGGVQVQASGTAGMVFSFQTSSDLAHWRTLDFTNSPDGNAAFSDNYVSPTGPSNRFYRVRLDAPATTVTVTNYHGWTNCLVMRNGMAEVDIVPTVGRIMQFRFSGADERTVLGGHQHVRRPAFGHVVEHGRQFRLRQGVAIAANLAVAAAARV